LKPSGKKKKSRKYIFSTIPGAIKLVSSIAWQKKISGGGRGLAISGGKIVSNRSLPDGQRAISIKIAGEELDPDKTYRLATTDYLMEGNSGLYMLKDIPRDNVAFTGILLREALIEYINANSPLEPKTDGRWKRDEEIR
jgi:2',3'-cyclic-nucleotide 2'-phosphodiesterase (5'-nucleotidase family)